MGAFEQVVGAIKGALNSEGAGNVLTAMANAQISLAKRADKKVHRFYERLRSETKELDIDISETFSMEEIEEFSFFFNGLFTRMAQNSELKDAIERAKTSHGRVAVIVKNLKRTHNLVLDRKKEILTERQPLIEAVAEYKG